MNEQYELAIQSLGEYKNIVEAVSILTKLAEDGHSESQRKLGYMYLRGEYVLPDYKEAYKWTLLAHRQGHLVGTFNLGLIYYSGYDEIKQNKEEAFRLFMICALSGNAHAMKIIGYSYQHGEGVEPNPSEALRWYRKYLTAYPDDIDVMIWIINLIKTLIEIYDKMTTQLEVNKKRITELEDMNAILRREAMHEPETCQYVEEKCRVNGSDIDIDKLRYRIADNIDLTDISALKKVVDLTKTYCMTHHEINEQLMMDKKRITQLEEINERLRTEVLYQPDGDGYIQAMQHFKATTIGVVDSPNRL